MTTELTITTERIDDFPLLLGVRQRLGLPAILDRHLRRHGLQQGLSWGWIATLWLAHTQSVSQGDPRKLPVQAWVRQAGETLVRITGLTELTELDFTDDRLAIVLRRLRPPAAWAAIETDLGRNILRVYQVTPERRQTKYLGRGRGGPDRPQREIVTVRYPIRAVSRQAEAIAAQQATRGWRVYVTNAPSAQLTLADAVLTYRDQWGIERGFHRLNGAP